MPETGVDFVKRNLPKFEGRQESAFGGSIAIGDYDGDGDLDLYFAGAPVSRLYRNEGNWRFTDVTEGAGVGNHAAEGRAAAWGDYNNDGCADLYVANLFSSSVLYRNNCNETFTDVTREARTGYSGPTHHVAWGDYNRDGCIDLYLANYFDWLKPERFNFSPDSEKYRTAYTFTTRDGEPNTLYRNRCDGTFANATEESGAGDIGLSFAAVFSDLDGDRWPDLYIANDFGTNNYLRNAGNGTFVNWTEVSGSGYRGNGMGVDSGDYDNDGDLDLAVTNIVWIEYLANRLGVPPGEKGARRSQILARLSLSPEAVAEPLSLSPAQALEIVRDVMLDEGTALYRNDGLRFTNVAPAAGVHRVEWGWGVAWFDYNGDGWLDLYAANGFNPLFAEFKNLPNHLFRNMGDGTFQEVEAGAADRGDSRGVAYGDLDGDGDLDLVVVNHEGPARLYRNDAGNPRELRSLEGPSPDGLRNHWLIVKLVGSCGPNWRGGSSPAPVNFVNGSPPPSGTWAPCSNRDGIGAWVKVKAGSLTLLREVKAGSGYQSQSQLWPHFGLGGATTADVRIEWPSGAVQTLSGVAVNRVLEVVEP